jgi:hypothetical protein
MEIIDPYTNQKFDWTKNNSFGPDRYKLNSKNCWEFALNFK